MKRNIIIIAALAASVLLSSCGSADKNDVGNTAGGTQTDSAVTASTVSDEQAQTDSDVSAASTSSEESSASSAASKKSAASSTASNKAESSADNKAANSESVKNSENSKSTAAASTANTNDNEADGQKFYAVENPPASSISVASLDGVWHNIANDTRLWFTKDEDLYKGTWHDELEEGDVRFEYSENGGEKTYWFNLYNNRGQLWYSIYAAGEIPFDEFVVKNDEGEDFHYVRETESADTDTENSASGTEYHSVENPPATSVSVASLDGVWHSTSSDSTLWFTKSDDLYKGTWHDEMEEGDVRFEYSENGGEKMYWFNLYNNRGQLWYSIYAKGDVPFDEFVVKNDNGDDFHYVRDAQ
ncbi:MAG: hypothetical protein IIY78_04580 [Clostridia bacterium]|nr:hypothetical protein [Clostridia bacterium]